MISEIPRPHVKLHHSWHPDSALVSNATEDIRAICVVALHAAACVHKTAPCGDVVGVSGLSPGAAAGVVGFEGPEGEVREVGAVLVCGCFAGIAGVEHVFCLVVP